MLYEINSMHACDTASLALQVAELIHELQRRDQQLAEQRALLKEVRLT